MESNWRYNIELVGLSEPFEAGYTGLPPGRVSVRLVAQLSTPFTLFGTTYTHMIQADVDGVGKRWVFAGLLANKTWATIFGWQTSPGGFPHGANVLPD